MQTTYLLISLFICHFLADYTHLSTPWMLGAKRFGKPLFPILFHAWIHAFLMYLVLLYFNERNKDSVLVGIFLFEWSTHFVIDVWKGRMNIWFPSLQDNKSKWHWVVFGADQLLHAIVILLMIGLWFK